MRGEAEGRGGTRAFSAFAPVPATAISGRYFAQHKGRGNRPPIGTAEMPFAGNPPGFLQKAPGPSGTSGGPCFGERTPFGFLRKAAAAGKRPSKTTPMCKILCLTFFALLGIASCILKVGVLYFGNRRVGYSKTRWDGFLLFRGVAQFGRALGSGPRGHGFKSRHSDHR